MPVKRLNLPLTEISVVFLFWAMLFGAVVRFTPVILTDFPINDGGLFYVMAEDLRRAGYVLPDYTTYNAASIPFAYPPLGIYFVAILSDIFMIPSLQLFRWLPGSSPR